ncbi:unnamed protein product, partial [Polarella glacialis]
MAQREGGGASSSRALPPSRRYATKMGSLGVPGGPFAELSGCMAALAKMENARGAAREAVATAAFHAVSELVCEDQSLIAALKEGLANQK